MNKEQIDELAASILGAEKTKKWVEAVSSRATNATVDDAYRIAMSVASLKQAEGRTIKGHKIGLTSKAMRDLVGSDEPDYGFLFDDWFVQEASVVDRSQMNQPLVEVELAFVMGKPLCGPHVHAADVIRATEFVLPALEIVDSRFAKLGPNVLVDSVSDAASCGCVVLGGNPALLADVDLRRMSASLSVNGEIRETGSAAAVMGNPINAVAWLANKMHDFDISMKEGDVILSGSFIKAVPFDAGDTIHAMFDTLGEVTLNVA